MSSEIKNSLYEFLFRRPDAMIPLRKGLDAYTLRQKVIAANLANSETPDYKAKRVDFESELSKVLDRRKQGMLRTNREHLPVSGGLQSMRRLKPKVVDEETQARFNGANNVDIDREMGQMATNQIHFAAASKVLATRYRLLLSAIRGRA